MCVCAGSVAHTGKVVCISAGSIKVEMGLVSQCWLCSSGRKGLAGCVAHPEID